MFTSVVIDLKYYLRHGVSIEDLGLVIFSEKRYFKSNSPEKTVVPVNVFSNTVYNTLKNIFISRADKL